MTTSVWLFKPRSGYISRSRSNKRINVSSATRRGFGSRARPATGWYFGRFLVLLEESCNRSRAGAHDSPRTLFERSETCRVTEPPPTRSWHIAFVLLGA